MSKKYPPKNYDNIGDPNRTEGAASGIVGGGRGQTFKKEDENFTKMLERRSEDQKGKGVQAIEKKMRELEQKPEPTKEAKNKEVKPSKEFDKDPKPSR